MSSKNIARFVPDAIIAIVMTSRRLLTDQEKQIAITYLANLGKIQKATTKQQITFGFYGLVGSGKTSLAKEIARPLGATIISNDSIRVLLRSGGIDLGRAQFIAEWVAREVIKEGGNIIFDSDLVDERKRVALTERLKKQGVPLILIRTVAPIDTMIGWAFAASYEKGSFFEGASVEWNGDPKFRGAIVKVREMLRRIPHHYTWDEKKHPGGVWIYRKFPRAVVTIDMGALNWKNKARSFVAALRKKY